jgi:hypothetical protein
VNANANTRSISRAIRRPFFGYVDLKKKRVSYPSVMHFKVRLASGLEDIYELFAEFIQRTYMFVVLRYIYIGIYTDDVWVTSDPGPEHVPPFGALQFTTDRVKSILQDLDVNMGPGIPPIILKNCASAFAKPLSLLFNRSMATSIFPDRWNVSYVTPIFKKSSRNNVEDYRGVAILSAIPKCFELLYNDLKNLMSINQHGFMKNRLTITNLLAYASFVLIQLRTDIRLIPSIQTFQRFLTVCVINCCWMRCLWVSSPQNAYGWDLICQGESRK